MASRRMIQAALKQHQELQKCTFPYVERVCFSKNHNSIASFHSSSSSAAAAKEDAAPKKEVKPDPEILYTRGLVDAISENLKNQDEKLPKKTVKSVLTALTEVIHQTGKDGKKVRIAGLGTFEPVSVPDRYHTNPQEPRGEKILKRAHMTMKFKKSTALDKKTFGQKEDTK